MTDNEIGNQPEKTPQKRVDKLTLNNQIVSMRKDVKRARLWVINNLNSKAKKLLNKKGNDQQKAKNTRKAERCRSEMQILKHIDVDEVSKFALCSKLEPAEVVSELEKLEADQRAMLRLAYHKLVQTRITTFRKDNPVPIDRLVLLIRALGLKYQKKKQAKKLTQEGTEESKFTVHKTKVISNVPSKSKQLKEKSKISRNEFSEEEEDDEKGTQKDREEQENEVGKENEDEQEDENEQEDEDEQEESSGIDDNSKDVKDVKSQKIFSKDYSNREKSVKVDSNSKQISDHSEKEPALGNQETSSAKVKLQPKERLKIQWPVVKEPTIDRKDGDCEIKRLNLEKLNADEIIFESNDTINSRSKSFEVPRDSFFLGGVDPSSEEEDETEKKPPRELERNSFKGMANDRFNQRPNKSFQKERPRVDKKADKFANNTPLGNPRQFGGSSQQRSQPGESTSLKASASEKLNAEEDNLHPSWQAKRKQQVSLTAFQGKKIKFDDDE